MLNQTSYPDLLETPEALAAKTIVMFFGMIFLFFLGVFLGVGLSRRPNATRRVQLEALEYYLYAAETAEYNRETADAVLTVSPPETDEITRGIARRQIRRLQDSLGIDNDQD